MRHETLTESHEQVLTLSSAEAGALRDLGRKLAVAKAWWDGDERFDKRPSVVCEPVGDGLWRVVVGNAVGLISIGTLQISIRGKIPTAHLLYLFSRADDFPPFSGDSEMAESDESLWHLIARWFVRVCEQVLHKELPGELDGTGSGEPLAVGQSRRVAYSAKIASGLVNHELAANTAHNRVVKAAVRTMATSPLLDQAMRRRAIWLLEHMDDVRNVRTSDLEVARDKLRPPYSDAVLLARHLIRLEGRVLENGQIVAWAFLVPTHRRVEAGIQAVLSGALRGSWSVRKRKSKVPVSHLVVRQDVAFGSQVAVVEVKYELLGEEWKSPDLSELSDRSDSLNGQIAALVGFRLSGSDAALMPKAFQGTLITELTWNADESTLPENSAAQLIEDAWTWLFQAQDC